MAQQHLAPAPTKLEPGNFKAADPRQAEAAEAAHVAVQDAAAAAEAQRASDDVARAVATANKRHKRLPGSEAAHGTLQMDRGPEDNSMGQSDGSSGAVRDEVIPAGTQGEAAGSGSAAGAGQQGGSDEAQQAAVDSTMHSGAASATRPAAKAGKVVSYEKGMLALREMVSEIAQDGYLLVTWADYQYLDFLRTWVAHVQQVGVTGYIIGAMDDQLLQQLSDDQFNCFRVHSILTQAEVRTGAAPSVRLGRGTIRLIALFLKMDVHVIVSDVDVTWLRNPIPFFQRFPTADLLTSSDHLTNTVPDDSLELWPQAGSTANIGIMLFRHKALSFVEEWINVVAQDETVWDQNAFNTLFTRGTQQLADDPQHLFLAYNSTLRMGILPVAVFCNGHTFYVQRLAEQMGVQPYAVHSTFQFSGTSGKRHRMREMQLWQDPPEYYTHPVGFVSFEVDGMAALLASAGPSTGQMDLDNVQGHFALVNHQLVRVRGGVAVAGLLGRALIMPQLWAGQDRWWAPHPGRIPGSNPRLPMRVPMDHIFDIEHGWSTRLPEDEFGPNVPFKEYSFVNNSKVPPSVLESQVIVEVCPAGTTGCSNGLEAAPVEESGVALRVRIQAGLKSAQLKVALRHAAQYQVLHFTNIADAWGGYTDAADWEKLQRRVRLSGGTWCCTQGNPGHVHYDMLWDVPGHTDKFNKTWPGAWTVTTGP